MTINTDELEDWALRAAQALQDIVDETETSEGTSDCCHDIKALLGELDDIVAGEPCVPGEETCLR